MASKRITDLTLISTIDIDTALDPLPIVDVSDTSQASSGTTKKVTVDQIESSIFGATGSKAIVVDNVAALKALTVASVDDGQVFLTRGYYSDNDGGQGSYIYDSTSATADNGGTVIAPTTGSGRYLLQHNGRISAKQFGAKGDSVSDDTAKIQAAITAIGSTGGEVYLPSGKYLITGRINMASTVALIGDDVGRGYYYALTKYGTWIYVNHGSGGSSQANAAIKLADNSSVKNISFFYPGQLDGDATSGSPVVFPPTITCGSSSGTNAVNDAVISNCCFYNSYFAIDHYGAQRCYLDEINIGLINTGIKIGYNLDTCKYTRIHFWPFYQPSGSPKALRTYCETNGVCFLGCTDNSVDGTLISDISCYGVKNAFNFPSSTGRNWISISNFNMDAVLQFCVINNASEFGVNFSDGLITAGTETNGATFVNDAVCKVSGIKTNEKIYFQNVRIIPAFGTFYRYAFTQDFGNLFVNSCNVYGVVGTSGGNTGSDVYITSSGADVNRTTVIKDTFFRSSFTGATIYCIRNSSTSPVIVTGITTSSNVSYSTTVFTDNASSSTYVSGSVLYASSRVLDDTSGGTTYWGADNFDGSGVVFTTSAKGAGPIILPKDKNNSTTGTLYIDSSDNSLRLTRPVTDTLKYVPLAVTNQVDSTATTVAGLVTDFNALLAKLRTANLLRS